jgi:hypothetical protein
MTGRRSAIESPLHFAPAFGERRAAKQHRIAMTGVRSSVSARGAQASDRGRKPRGAAREASHRRVVTATERPCSAALQATGPRTGRSGGFAGAAATPPAPTQTACLLVAVLLSVGEQSMAEFDSSRACARRSVHACCMRAFASIPGRHEPPDLEVCRARRLYAGAHSCQKAWNMDHICS